MILKSLDVMLRSTSDILIKQQQQLLKPSSALNIVEHHLNASGIIERSNSSNNNSNDKITATRNNNILYDHNWFCVGQSVTCYPVNNLFLKSLDTKQNSPSLNSMQSLLHVMDVKNSSIHFGHVIIINDNDNNNVTVATIRRVFCRLDKITGKSSPFSEDERARFLKYKEEEQLSTSITLPNVMKRFDNNSFLTVFDNIKNNKIERILVVSVGPQHINYGNHADHAFLADVAFHALTLIDDEKGELSSTTLMINYISEVFLGNTLECYYYDDALYVIRRLENGDMVIVLVAKMT